MMALIEVAKGETEAEIDYETLEVKFNHGVYSLTPEGLQVKEKPLPASLSENNTRVSTLRQSIEPTEIHSTVLSDGAPSTVTSPPSQSMISLGKRQSRVVDDAH